MKKIILLLFILVSLSSFSHEAFKITIKRDSQRSIFQINVHHKVKKTKKHYIKSIKIKINGKKIIEQIFTIQETKKMAVGVYKISEIKKGDVLEIEAECIKGGIKIRKLKITN